MDRTRGYGLFLLSLLAAFWVAGACAQERFEARIYRVGKTGAGECIGDTSTPRCALETLIACACREQLSLCKKVGLDTVISAEDEQVEYAILSEHRIETKPLESIRFQRGNIVFQLMYRACASTEGTCRESRWGMRSFAFRPGPSGYVFVTSWLPIWPD